MSVVLFDKLFLNSYATPNIDLRKYNKYATYPSIL